MPKTVTIELSSELYSVNLTSMTETENLLKNMMKKCSWTHVMK